ncbi:TetR family transcriptional regulator (plasmid) [Azospirillum sp. TSH58]|uniref:TetR/AcrR family transcriptional regulator n=1 Tax=Azospirillum sp. TSH58 TaxID=664962 RepID=UPI000D5FFA30|nr:TetR/AcrR family transcriptional regulator [Azospirillum sp. TSH58]AWJ82357.1 TetR family transcriptional regulator [Azospirillum sp. TSH58]PWC72925.1 hypothetical protein TSH58_06535 [Azospirillum sp. TSH58]
MARPLSEDKRTAILSAAAHWVAEEGLSARTAKIAKSAAVAEGTIFNYFPTKDDLLNELYVALKCELGDAMLAGFLQREELPGRWEMIWDAYIDWSVGNDVKRRALRQLRVSGTITPESRKAALGAMEAMATALFDGPDADRARSSSREFTAAVFEALAEMTIELIAKNPSAHALYRRKGFESFWRATSGD